MNKMSNPQFAEWRAKGKKGKGEGVKGKGNSKPDSPGTGAVRDFTFTNTVALIAATCRSNRFEEASLT
jgi:hypothetical protein